jgi:hypothetical protein
VNGINNTEKPDVVRLAYSRAEAARALGVSVVTISRARAAGLMRGNFIGRVDRIPSSEVERVAAEGLPPIPHHYVRVTTGPTKRGRPRKTAKPKAAKETKRRRSISEAQAAS